jgi:hypothetical protein
MQYNYYSSEELETFKNDLIEELEAQWSVTGLVIYVDKEEMLLNDIMVLSNGKSEVVFL